jgi:hypothetical protein
LNRALKARDPRYVRIFGKLGYHITALTPTDAEPEPSQIPEGWRDLPWPALKSLAASVSDERIKTKEDAEAAIDLELKRREKDRS